MRALLGSRSCGCLPKSDFSSRSPNIANTCRRCDSACCQVCFRAIRRGESPLRSTNRGADVSWFRQSDLTSLNAETMNEKGAAVAAAAPAAVLPVEDPTQGDWYVALKRQLHQQVIGAIDLASIGSLGEDQLRMEVRRKAEGL